MSEITSGTPAESQPTTTEQTEAPQTEPTSETKAAMEEAKPAETPAVKKFKVKIDDQEQEVDEAELIAAYQIRKAGMKRFEEAKQEREMAAKEKAQAEELYTRLKSDPKSVLKDKSLGFDVRKLAEDILVEEFENELTDPKDREMRALKAELDKFKSEQEATAKAKEEEAKTLAYQAEEAKWVKHYEVEIPKALTAVGLDFNDPAIIAAMDRAITEDLGAKLNTPLELLARDVKSQREATVKGLLKSLDPAQLYELLGSDGYKALTETVSKKFKPSVQADSNSTKDALSKSKTFMSGADDILAALRASRETNNPE
jgi:hypothetical protein